MPYGLGATCDEKKKEEERRITKSKFSSLFSSASELGSKNLDAIFNTNKAKDFRL